MTLRIGVHFIRRRLLEVSLERNGGRSGHGSAFRCADGFDAMAAATSACGDVRYEVWDERCPPEEFVAAVDVLVGIPDIRLLLAREHTGRRPPYLAMVMGDATRAVPFSPRVMERLQVNDILVCTSAADRDILRMFLRCPGEWSVDLAPMVGDLSVFAAGGRLPKDLAAVLDRVDPARPVLLSAERLTPSKGVETVVRMTGRLRTLGLDPVLLLLGAPHGPTTPFQRELRDLADGLGVAGSLVFLPFLDRAALAAVYTRADLTVSAATIYDSNFGYVPIESMSAGTPPVVSDWGGYRDSVVAGVSGLHMPTILEPDGTVTVHWRAATEDAADLLADPTAYGEMATAGRRWTEQAFSLPAAIRRYAELARRALEADAGVARPWGLSELGRLAVTSGWVAKVDNADRSERLPLRSGPTSAEHDLVHRLVYERYATHCASAAA